MSWYTNPEQFTDTAVRSKKRREWLGAVDGEIPDHAPFVGGSWFEKKFPNGISSHVSTSSSQPVSTNTQFESQKEEETIEEPKEESVAEESVPTQTEQWKLYIQNGISYVINTNNNKVFKADMTKSTCKEMVMHDEFVGVFQDGMINTYANQEDVDE